MQAAVASARDVGEPSVKGVPLKQRMMLLSVGAALTTMALKFTAWRVTGSVGLFSDAAESVVNLLAASFGFFALRIAAKPPDDDHALGHHKVEFFSSGIEGLLILVAAVAIIRAAVLRLMAPVPVESLGMGFAFSMGAAVVNGGVALALLRVGKREDSIILEADGHHLLTDVWTSLGILAGLVIMTFIPGATWIDPALAILVALHISWVGLSLLRRSVDGLMDRALPEREQQQIVDTVRHVLPEEAEVTHLRTFKAGSVRFITFNLLVPGDMTVDASHALCDRAEAILEEAFAPSTVTIHVEPLSPGDGSAGRPPVR